MKIKDRIKLNINDFGEVDFEFGRKESSEDVLKKYKMTQGEYNLLCDIFEQMEKEDLINLNLI